ncbi:hypothetical protein OROHE_007094 [Orobanche hederae]
MSQQDFSNFSRIWLKLPSRPIIDPINIVTELLLQFIVDICYCMG